MSQEELDVNSTSYSQPNDVNNFPKIFHRSSIADVPNFSWMIELMRLQSDILLDWHAFYKVVVFIITQTR